MRPLSLDNIQNRQGICSGTVRRSADATMNVPSPTHGLLCIRTASSWIVRRERSFFVGKPQLHTLLSHHNPPNSTPPGEYQHQFSKPHAQGFDYRPRTNPHLSKDYGEMRCKLVLTGGFSPRRLHPAALQSRE